MGRDQPGQRRSEAHSDEKVGLVGFDGQQPGMGEAVPGEEWAQNPSMLRSTWVCGHPPCAR